MGKIILRLDRVMADRKMSLNELSEAICETLHCQPGDILEYDPDAEKEK